MEHWIKTAKNTHSRCSWMSADTSECDLGHEKEELNSPLLVEPARVESGGGYDHFSDMKRQKIMISDKILIINLNIKHFSLFNVTSLSSWRRCRLLSEIQGTQKCPYTHTTDGQKFWLITSRYIRMKTNILDEVTSCSFCSRTVTSYWPLLGVCHTSDFSPRMKSSALWLTAGVFLIMAEER